jgi:large subunit ribosomal protein L28
MADARQELVGLSRTCDDADFCGARRTISTTSPEHELRIVLHSRFPQKYEFIPERMLRVEGTRPIAQSTQPPVKSTFALQDLNSSSEYLGVVMAQQCDICGKKPQAGNRISHAHNVTKRRWNINLKPVHAKVAGQGKRMRVCTSCIRSGKVAKA